MSNITLTSVQVNTLKGASSTTVAGKALKKTVWAALRSSYRIPESVKFSVEIDNTADPLYGVLKDKVTRRPLKLDRYGRYDAAATNYVAPAAYAPAAQQQGSVSVSNPAGSSASPQVRRVSRTQLLSLLRAYTTTHSVPHTGAHPTLSNVDSLGLDQSNGDLYFRVR